MIYKQFWTLCFFCLTICTAAQTNKEIQIQAGSVLPLQLRYRYLYDGFSYGMQYNELGEKSGIGVQFQYAKIKFEDADFEAEDDFKYFNFGVYYMKNMLRKEKFQLILGLGIGGSAVHRPEMKLTLISTDPPEERIYYDTEAWELTVLYRSQIQANFYLFRNLSVGICANFDIAPEFITLNTNLVFTPHLQVSYHF